MKQTVTAQAAPAASTHQFVADPLALMAARAVTALVAAHVAWLALARRCVFS